MSHSESYSIPSGGQQATPIQLTPALLGSLKVAKIFKDNTQIITSLDFDDSGTKCITSAQDESLHVYDCVTGKVVALEMSPVDDQFIAGSEDAVRLWDLRSPNCQGAVSIVGRPAVAFDPSGLVFAIALGCTLRLYDLKCFDQGPFKTAEIGQSLGINPTTIVATQLEFSSDGKDILVTTSADAHYIVDSFDATTKFRLVGHYSYSNEAFQSGGETSWTPDGRFVFSGSKDGGIYVWDIARATADAAAAGSGATNTYLNGANGSGGSASNSGSLLGANGELRPFKVLKAHGTPSHIVAFNPKYLMMVSGSTELAFWEPDPNAVGMDALHDFSKGGRH
ncbi:WD repeat-containing protein 82 [Lunasporangiospora selenospora]|uniref:WD repeat-containing protein 82 n=1 Tax=Lunasporangiospora selenospora TaxID=979761 RepID=A0A9P6FQE0_9FUNG|nr:WD repeat-containing protein 82 [Lunasporangiospora selenospora]